MLREEVFVANNATWASRGLRLACCIYAKPAAAVALGTVIHSQIQTEVIRKTIYPDVIIIVNTRTFWPWSSAEQKLITRQQILQTSWINYSKLDCYYWSLTLNVVQARSSSAWTGGGSSVELWTHVIHRNPQVYCELHLFPRSTPSIEIPLERCLRFLAVRKSYT